VVVRVVALVVVACGCRVAAAPGINAATPHDAGFPDRVITDVALWADVRAGDEAMEAPPVDQKSVGDGLAATDALARDGAGGGGGSDGGGDGGNEAGVCGLLAQDCPGKEACYPFPFEGTPAGQTRCSFPGVGAESTPCQSQLECDGTSLCSTPGLQSDSICVPRCDPQNPRCPVGRSCREYPGYPGIGVCM